MGDNEADLNGRYGAQRGTANFGRKQTSSFRIRKGGLIADHWPLAWRLYTKVHALTAVIGRPFALMLTSGNVSDQMVASHTRYLLPEKECDADQFRLSER